LSVFGTPQCRFGFTGMGTDIAELYRHRRCVLCSNRLTKNSSVPASSKLKFKYFGRLFCCRLKSAVHCGLFCIHSKYGMAAKDTGFFYNTIGSDSHFNLDRTGQIELFCQLGISRLNETPCFPFLLTRIGLCPEMNCEAERDRQQYDDCPGKRCWSVHNHHTSSVGTHTLPR